MRLHDDQRAALRLVLLHAVGQGSLGHHLDRAVEGELERGAIDRIATLAVTQHDRPISQVPDGCLEAGLATKNLVVVALDAVIALTRVVRKAQEIRRHAAAGHAAVDVDALGFRDLSDPGKAKAVQLLGDRGRDAPRQVDELSRGRQLDLDLTGSELQHRRQPGGDVLPLRGRNQVRRREDRKDRRVGDQQRTIAVENVAAHGGEGDGVVVVSRGQLRHVAVPPHLPVHQPAQQHEISAQHQRHQREDASPRLEPAYAPGVHLVLSRGKGELSEARSLRGAAR